MLALQARLELEIVHAIGLIHDEKHFGIQADMFVLGGLVGDLETMGAGAFLGTIDLVAGGRVGDDE